MSTTLDQIAGGDGPPPRVLQHQVTLMQHQVFDALTAMLASIAGGTIDAVHLTKNKDGIPAVQVYTTSALLGKQGFEYQVGKTADTFMQTLAVAGMHAHDEIAAQVKDPERHQPWMQDYLDQLSKLNHLRQAIEKGRAGGGVIVPRRGPSVS